LEIIYGGKRKLLIVLEFLREDFKQDTRITAYELAKEGKIEVLQKGLVIPPEQFENLKGPIRLRKGPQEV
jgi:hypothetical protein